MLNKFALAEQVPSILVHSDAHHTLSVQLVTSNGDQTMKQVRSITAETHDFTWKTLPMRREKPRAPASNTSHCFQEFWVTTPYGGLQENNWE